MVSITDLQNVVFEYLSRSIDRKVFTMRIAEMLFRIPKDGNADVVGLAYAIQSRIGEAIVGLISEEELRSELSKRVISIEISKESRPVSRSKVEKETHSLYSPARMTFA
jgi:hypothetical protein